MHKKHTAPPSSCALCAAKCTLETKMSDEGRANEADIKCPNRKIITDLKLAHKTSIACTLILEGCLNLVAQTDCSTKYRHCESLLRQPRVAFSVPKIPSDGVSFNIEDALSPVPRMFLLPALNALFCCPRDPPCSFCIRCCAYIEGALDRVSLRRK